MKRLTMVILTSVILLVLLYSGVMPGSPLKPLQIVRAGKESLALSQTLVGFTTRVSIASNGMQGNNESSSSSLSADGRYVAFWSHASNLVSGDTNGTEDVFVHDRQTGQTSRVSVASNGIQGNNGSQNPSLSANGRYVVFGSFASNLASGDTNGWKDVFVHDRQTGQTSLVSVASDGTQGNYISSSHWGGGQCISADGRYVAFLSRASNLVSGDTNNQEDVFVHDRQTGQTSLVSVASDGTQGNSQLYAPSLSTDGRYVAFSSYANNLVSSDTNNYEQDVFVHDRQTGQTSLVSVASDGTQGNYSSSSPSLSDDGRYVVFESYASNLVSGDTNGDLDAFVHDRQTGQTSRVSIATNGTEGNDFSFSLSISADGHSVAFLSYASNLVSGDTNGVSDVFVHSFFNHVYDVYLPIVLSRQPTNLIIRNITTGLVSYTVYNTPQGNVTCSNIPVGVTFCGRFLPGTYNVSVSTTQCGAASGVVTFPPGDVTREVRCSAP